MNDRDQAYAAAGMTLLTGYASPVFRTLDGSEARQAEAQGYQLLGDLWHAPRPGDAGPPERNAGLREGAPEFGEVRQRAESRGFRDPRTATEGLEGRAQGRIQNTAGRVAGGEQRVQDAYETGSAAVDRHSADGFGAMHTDKAAYFREEIRQAANRQGSAAEVEYDVIGGAIYSVAQGANAAGSAALGGFLPAFERARDQGQSWGRALMTAIASAPEEASKAIDHWADERVAETGDKLTPAQKSYYRAAMLESFAGVPLTGDYNPFLGNLSAARQALTDEDRETAHDIADLLRRAAGQNRGDLIDLVHHYNRATLRR